MNHSLWAERVRQMFVGPVRVALARRLHDLHTENTHLSERLARCTSALALERASADALAEQLNSARAKLHISEQARVDLTRRLAEHDRESGLKDQLIKQLAEDLTLARAAIELNRDALAQRLGQLEWLAEGILNQHSYVSLLAWLSRRGIWVGPHVLPEIDEEDLPAAKALATLLQAEEQERADG